MNRPHHLNRAADPLYFERIVRRTLPSEPDERLRNFRHYAAILDAHFREQDWLVGDRISYADFRVATTLPFADRAGLPLHNFDHVRRWHDGLLAFDACREPFSGLS